MIYVCSIFLIGFLIIIGISIQKYFEFQIYKNRDYWDSLLEVYMKQAYDSIYSKHILPFVASSVTISTKSDDKFFLSLSTAFLDMVNKKAGVMKKQIYLKLYETEDNFNDIVLTFLTLRIQEEMLDNVISNNIEEQNKED